jgi:Holliday junction resolvasome RuvABC ATP-dependent DNA helicase subunit
MSQIENTLDNSLSIIRMAQEINATLEHWPNVMLSGLSGSGKTSITKQWAEDNGILLAPYDLSQDVTRIYVEDEGGILRPQIAEDPVAVAKQLIYNALINYKDRGDFVLFLDDYHWATKENKEAIFYTMDTHKIVNIATGEEVALNNLLFTIAIKPEGL